MPEAKDFDILISGAGIAGATLASALSGQGLRIGLIEAQATANTPLPKGTSIQDFDARVSAITPKSSALLEQVGAWSSVMAYRACAYHHMTVWDAQGTGMIEFDRDDLGVGCLGHIVENRAITSALNAGLAERNDVTRFSPAELAGCTVDGTGAVTVSLVDGRSLRADLLVAADGAMSKVRELLNFQTREWSYGHKAIVTTVQTQKSHENTAWQRFLPSGPLAFLPLPSAENLHLCSVVWSQEEARADELMALSDREFSVEIASALEHRLGDVTECAQRWVFPLRQRHAVDYVQPGVALVADAAHTIHPLAGQGINLGLQDVAVLAQEILAAVEAGANPGSIEVLRRYQRQRKGENLAMMAAMDGFKRLFEQDALPLRWLRNAGMRGVGRIAPIKQLIMRQAMGL
ncbi:UbiH/UbiF/VisC/COQ6 family ubiquinone biosynthesis hydroxylase [Marinobacter alexandrii]|uniref:UbiH/UbiF/VisC/COQ6 family ubiquinone biosynthesis hydroxylase n=1 Tax=Marinobacter alexandrii TaxID=2570351 RepID=UPI003296E58E